MEAQTIVTGGAGFIGSHLVDLLTDRGERVRVVERPRASVAHLPAGVEVVFADIRDERAVTAAMRGGRFVYHLAANPNLWARDRREFDAVNHQGTIHVLDAALANGAERRRAHKHREHPDLRPAGCSGRSADRRGCRGGSRRRGRSVLQVEAAG